jgi:hypothetical protein
MPANEERELSQETQGVRSAAELSARGKELDAAIAALRTKVKAREAHDWRFRHS